MYRFYDKLSQPTPTGCLEWLGYVNRYGRFRYQGRAALAHRVAWELAFGAIPEGMSVLHRCDNTRCCNALHLYLGDQQQNCADREDRHRGNHAQGESTNTCKLKSSDIPVIRALRNWSQFTVTEIAKEFHVATTTISNVMKSRTWAHVPGGY